ncbi:unnamed protein product [Owenia fusiformis]|uniref:Uncharacterized protein n=1 Tax=Owenia fusiformis TaxID=6347 RepID=A0A8J1UFH5_OWEFU|nr:unnamed protein product [Owenia fusiformis]
MFLNYLQFFVIIHTVTSKIVDDYFDVINGTPDDISPTLQTTLLSIVECTVMCMKEPTCKATNYNQEKQNCWIYDTNTFNWTPNSSWKLTKNFKLGESPSNPGASCLDIKSKRADPVSTGLYWINPDSSSAVQVNCNMDTVGLVVVQTKSSKVG